MLTLEEDPILKEVEEIPRECPAPERAKLTIGQRLILFRGKIRRWYLVNFRPAYVERSLANRQGECSRLGTCCHLGMSCPMLKVSDACTSCRIYELRPDNCRKFPIDERDLRDRDIVLPQNPCGYYFASPKE